MADETGEVERSGITLRFLGELYISRGELDEANTALNEALKIAQELEHEIMMADVFFVQAKLSFARGRHTESKQIGGKALMIYERLGDAQRIDILQSWMKSPNENISL